MHDIFIGVDGGGTKTKMRIEDEHENLIGETIGGPAQIRVSVNQAWDSIYAALKAVLTPAKISLDDKNYRFHIGLALAGTEFKNPYHDFLSRSHPFTTLCLKSDGYAACLGAHAGGNGAIIIVGTGVKGFQIENDNTSEVSGWGFPQGDEGSGAWIGLQALKYTLQNVDGRLPNTPLYEAVLAHFDNNLTGLLNWTIDATSTMYASLAPIVIEQAKQQETAAVNILKEAAKEIDRVGKALNLCVSNKNQPMPCALFGGIAPFIEPWLSDELKSRLVKRKYGPAKGAIFMIKETMQLKGYINDSL